MSQSPEKGIKLTTVVFAVFFLAVSALLSNTSVAGDVETELSQ